MPGDVIFMKQGVDLVPLAAAPYDAEKVLQALLQQYPELLAGAQMNQLDPRRFILVCREAPVSDKEGAGGRWSLDHLFLDQEAVPTLVEVKRSTDTRIRREVVGQMLDYAANAARFWAGDGLRVLFEQQRFANQTAEDDKRLEELIGADADADEFWARAALNLRRGMMRLVFVADVIPDELRAIIEFMNGRMTDTEVYGVEVRHYKGAAGAECYVPRLVGKLAVDKPSKGPIEDKLKQAGPEAIELRDRLRAWAGESNLEFRVGPGSFMVSSRGRTMAAINAHFGTMEFWLVDLRESSPSEIAQIKADLDRMAGKTLTDKYPSLPAHDALANWDAVAGILTGLAEIADTTSESSSADG
jgi:hypothetical protein